MANEDGILDYSVESVHEALELWAAGVPDPDPERRADLRHSFKRLTLDEATALFCREADWTLTAIARRLKGKADAKWASRLLVRAFANLRTAMNGGELDVTTSTDGRIVQRQDHAG